MCFFLSILPETVSYFEADRIIRTCFNKHTQTYLSSLLFLQIYSNSVRQKFFFCSILRDTFKYYSHPFFIIKLTHTYFHYLQSFNFSLSFMRQSQSSIRFPLHFQAHFNVFLIRSVNLETQIHLHIKIYFV